MDVFRATAGVLSVINWVNKLLIQFFFFSPQLRSSLVVLQQNFAMANRTAAPQWCSTPGDYRVACAPPPPPGPCGGNCSSELPRWDLWYPVTLPCRRPQTLDMQHVLPGVTHPKACVGRQVPGCFLKDWLLRGQSRIWVSSTRISRRSCCCRGPQKTLSWCAFLSSDEPRATPDELL